MAVIPLRATQRAAVQLDRAGEALRGAELDWLGAPWPVATTESGRRTYRCDLRLPVHAVGHEIAFHKAALVDLGPIRHEDGRLLADISWRSATLAPLFPVFAGQLVVTADRIALDGWYAPPGGRVGVALDRMLLGVAARRMAAWFLGLVAEGLGSVATGADEEQHAEGDDQDRP